MSQDAMGDRLKGYEKAETGRKFMPLLPIYARIDGRAFSKFTRGMKRPYDEKMSEIMIEVTRYLVRETGAHTGYTQSDEISLCWIQERSDSEVFFSGKIQKMVSTLSALATAKFVQLALDVFPERCHCRLPTFDARVFQVPSVAELENCFLWRVQDAIKNSIQMTSQHHFSHKELQGLNQQDQLVKLDEAGIVWGEFPTFFKEGTFIKRERYWRPAEGDRPGAIRSRIAEQDIGKFADMEDRTTFITAKSLEDL